MKRGGVLTLSMNGQSVFTAAGFVPTWKFMTLLLRWHSFVAEVVQLQACFGENYDNIHFNLGFFLVGVLGCFVSLVGFFHIP